MNPFDRLAPFIQEYIYAHNWNELRDAQVAACAAILDADDHVLIASGTASGKTEAALFPVLTQLTQSPSRSVGVLYIGPLKALINDQFVRVKDLLKEARFPAYHWHGEVSQTEKRRLLRAPSGILQITPESLEALLMNRDSAIPPLFCDTRFVIIDEIHAFIGSDRGTQILCQLERIQRLAGCAPRRIGLSATLHDYSSAENWLRSGTTRKVCTIKSAANRKIRIAAQHFEFPEDSNTAQPEKQKYYEQIYKATREAAKVEKAIVFTNNRAAAEEATRRLRDIAIQKNERDVFYVHHGSISALLREEAESALKAPGPAVTAATLTLELGIDLGGLDRVLQLGAPYSCASFVQRLGRSGRRGNPANMIFFTDEHCRPDAPLPGLLPWDLLRAIAIVELYIKEKWIEPYAAPTLPVSLLYHQTMSILKALGEASPGELARSVLTLSPFSKITREDFAALLLHLIKLDHLQRLEEGNLIIGLAGEKIVNSFHFYSVFADNSEYKVLCKAKEIGGVTFPPPAGSAFLLGGKAWKTEKIDSDKRIVYVREATGQVKNLWLGGAGAIHSRIMAKMRAILASNESYAYLLPEAAQRLEQARTLAKSAGLLESPVVPAGDRSVYLLPWLGSKQFASLRTAIQWGLVPKHDVAIGTIVDPYYMVLSSQLAPEKIQQLLSTLTGFTLDPIQLANSGEPLYGGKYSAYIPKPLLAKHYIADALDFNFHL